MNEASIQKHLETCQLSHQELSQSEPLSTINPLNKGLGAFELSQRPADLVRLGWNLLHEDLSLPSAVLYADKLRHNLNWMRQFIAAYGVKLAPHGKTTMAPALFRLQLESGAWGITLATANQTHVAYAHGVRRVLMANQLVGKANIGTIARLLHDPEFEFYCLVDSAAQVDQLGMAFSGSNQHLNVLIEIGVMDGRAGVRNTEQLESVLAAIVRRNHCIALRGVELYEGVLRDEAAIRSFLQHAIGVVRKLALENRFQGAPILLSGAGSAWFDVVAEEFAGAGLDKSIDIILRPGCYLTHDVGSYREAQHRILANNPIAHKMNSALLPALQVWAYVQSVPESKRGIIGLGKRDAAFDSGLPVPALHFRPGQESLAPDPGALEFDTHDGPACLLAD